MGDLFVNYNGNNLSPTPLVQQSFQFVDFGNRWGNVQQIQLNGYITGIAETGVITSLTNKFTGQFGTLTVLEEATTIYSWNNLHVDEITIGENPFFSGSFVPYTVRLRRHQVPSGVLDPQNEYTFSHTEDGLVTVNHKVGARGVKGTTGAFTNAMNFVKSLTGKNPFAAAFMPSGQTVLMSISENINRAEALYSVNEIYKYNTGSSQPYLEWFNASITDDFTNEYVTLESNLKLQGSPVYSNMTGLEASIASVENWYGRLQSLGFETGNLMVNSLNVVRDSGSATVEIKRSFISGYSSSDLTGYFDYTVSLNNDLTIPKESWKVEGDFICKGPLDYKLQRLNAFKSVNGSDWRTFLSGLIVASPIYISYHSGGLLTPTNNVVSIQENTGLATFHASLVFGDGAYPNGLNSPKYSVEIYPSKWTYDYLPSANIEGHYVIQDLQMMTQAKMTFSVEAESTNPATTLPILQGMIGNLETIYVDQSTSGAVVNESFNTGLYDSSYNKEWLGSDLISQGLLNTKVFGSTLANYNRNPGFKFGY